MTDCPACLGTGKDLELDGPTEDLRLDGPVACPRCEEGSGLDAPPDVCETPGMTNTATTSIPAEDITAYTNLADGATVLEYPAQIFRSLGIVKIYTTAGVRTYRLGEKVEVA